MSFPCSFLSNQTNTHTADEIPTWEMDGGVILLFLALFQLCWALSYVCDDFFCASLVILCEKWKIPSDVVGATIMAAGNSVPDMIISFLALFVQHSSIGLGTIIGSAVINHLVCCGLAVFFAPNRTLRLDPVIFTRECVFYGLSLLLMFYVVSGASFSPSKWENCISTPWQHGVLLVSFYVLYVFVVIYTQRIENWYRSSKYAPVTWRRPINTETKNDKSQFLESLITPSESESAATAGVGSTTGNSSSSASSASSTTTLYDSGLTASDSEENSTTQILEKLRPDIVHPESEQECQDHQHQQPELEVKTNEKVTTTASGKLLAKAEVGWNYFIAPFKFIIDRTMYDVRGGEENKNRDKFMITLVVAICWMGGLSQLLLLILDDLGKLFRISPMLMGVTISAMGASLPTLWSSIIPSRYGYGNMAVCNSFGANTFCFFIGVGLPYFAYPLYLQQPYRDTQDQGIKPMLLMLFLLVVYHYVFMIFNKWQMNTFLGASFIVFYFVSIAVMVTICTRVQQHENNH